MSNLLTREVPHLGFVKSAGGTSITSEEIAELTNRNFCRASLDNLLDIALAALFRDGVVDVVLPSVDGRK